MKSCIICIPLWILKIFSPESTSVNHFRRVEFSQKVLLQMISSFFATTMTDCVDRTKTEARLSCNLFVKIEHCAKGVITGAIFACPNYIQPYFTIS